MNLSTADLSWTTSFEKGIQGFYLQRGAAETGVYNRISDLIVATGDSEELKTYTYADVDLDQNQAYFYKLEAIDLDGNTIKTFGPFSTLSSTPTVTITPTIYATPTQTKTPSGSTTAFPTRTATRYIFRTLTPIPTARNTPQRAPTQVRTYGRTPTQFQTGIVNATQQTDPNTGYPMPQEQTPTPSDQVLGLGEEPENTPFAPGDEGTPPAIAELPENQENASDTSTSEDMNEIVATSASQRLKTVQWSYLILGLMGGLGLLGVISFILTKTRFPSA